MVLKFDLFKLHVPEEDINIRSWIRVRGIKLSILLGEMISKVMEKGNSLNKISSILSKDLDIPIGTVYSQLHNFSDSTYSGRKGYISLAVLDSFIKNFYLSGYDELRWKLIDSIEYISTGSSRSKETKAVKFFSGKLSEIAGAHAADGHLCRYKTSDKSTIYRWEIIDREKEALLHIEKSIKELFGIDAGVKKSNHENAYTIILNNKVIVRYLNRFMGFKYGDKTETVTVPPIIKENKKYEKQFLRGFMTFDGCVDSYGYVRLSIKNKYMIKEIRDIFKENEISLKYSEEKTRKGVYSFRINIEGNDEFLDYFFMKSRKWKRVQFFLTGRVDKIEDLFPGEIVTKILVKEVISKSKEFGIFTVDMMEKVFNLSSRSMRSNLRILEKAGILMRLSGNSPNYRTLKNELSLSFPVKSPSKIYVYNGE